MKTYKKFIPLVVLVGQLIGCSMYSSKAGTKEEMAGTYELSVYEKKDDEGNYYDYKAQINSKAYFSLDTKGYGYYAYSDNDTPLKVSSMFARFKEDDEKPGLYKAIDFCDGVTHCYDWQKKVGCGDEPIMGFNRETNTFSYTNLYHEYKIYNPPKISEYYRAVYKKISDTTGMDKINEVLGTSIKFDKPFEMKKMEGLYIYTCQSADATTSPFYGDYEYLIVDMDSYANNKLKAYYSLKENPGKVAADIPVELIAKEDSISTVKITINETEFFSTSSGDQVGVYFYTDYTSENPKGYYGENISRYYGSATTVDELIAEMTK